LLSYLRTMSLKQTPLPASIIAQLYHDTIVDFAENTSKAQPVFEKPASDVKIELEGSSTLKWLGENRKNILVIVQHNDVVHLPDDELKLLTDMLAACGLGLADTAIVNFKSDITGHQSLLDKFIPKIVFLFGVEPADFGLPLSFPHFQIQPFAKSSFLFSPSLTEIKNDQVLKSKLWVSLRRLFNI
jgi:hypothetical protein